jgi:hypothetical protein
MNMITLARIQGHSMGHPGWQRPIFPLLLGQNGNGTPAPTPPTPSPAPPSVDFVPSFPVPIYPPVYNYPVITDQQPVVVAPKETAPNWALIAAGVAAGVVLTLILT